MEFTWKVEFEKNAEGLFEDNRFAGEVLLGKRVVYTFDPAHWMRVAQCNGIKILSVTLVITDMPYSVDWKIEQVY